MSTPSLSSTSTPPDRTQEDRQQARRAELAASDAMEPVAGTTDVNVPIDELWRVFDQPRCWYRWNSCFYWALNRSLRLGDSLVWAFQPIRAGYLYKMFATAKIVELVASGPRRKVTWEVTALPGFFARHTYHLEDLGQGRTRFGSWEKAMGPSFSMVRRFWLAHFRFVCQRSLEGAQRLGQVFEKTGRLETRALPGTRPGWRLLRAALALVALLAVAGASWFYWSFVRQRVATLAPGVHLVTGGGGNSLVIADAGEVMVVDTKFDLGARSLRRWVDAHTSGRVRYVVNTHYHYDHTKGNSLYPGATIVAHERVGELLDRNEPALARTPGLRPGAEAAVGATPRTLKVGRREVVLFHPGPAHSQGDLVVYLPAERILATGDLFFHTYYPFFDLRPGGADLAGLIRADRALAADYRDAVIVPGHGPVARAGDLEQYADYLTFLRNDALERRREQRTPGRAAARSLLPSFHQNQLTWATAKQNARDADQLVQPGPSTVGKADHHAPN